MIRQIPTTLRPKYNIPPREGTLAVLDGAQVYLLEVGEEGLGDAFECVEAFLFGLPFFVFILGTGFLERVEFGQALV